MPILLPGSPIPITLADSGAVSPFGRLNVNNATSIFNSQQQYGDDPTVWETQTAGTGVMSFLPNESTILMSTGGTGATASIIRQTRIYHRYTPGHGSTAIMTFCFTGGPTFTNNSRRVGYYDAGNGVYLECAGTTVSLCQRTSVSGSVSDANKISQASWNVDTFGAGTLNPSGITINWADTQIMIIDLQWLGVGRVRIGFDIGGVFYPAHYFENANALPTVYMTTANLPVRYENFNTGVSSGTSTLRHICSQVMTDGGVSSFYGKQYSYNNGGSGLAITSGATAPVISLQAATTGPNGVRNTGQIIAASYTIQITGSNNIFWQLMLNPTTLTGASFASYGTSSIANVDHSATVASGGMILDSGYLFANAGSKGTIVQNADIKTLVLVYSGLLNHQDVMTLLCTAEGGGSTVFCSFNWLEIW